MKRIKEDKEPLYNISRKGFNVKAWYLKDTKTSKGDALVIIKYKRKIIRKFIFPAYKIYNIGAHFEDIIEGELSKDDKTRGYRIAASTGFGGSVEIKSVR